MKFPSSIISLALLLGLAAAATNPDCSRKFKCLMDYEPICGSDGKTYANECVFNNAVCLAIAQKTPPLTKLFEGPCTMDPNPFCSTGCTKIYKPVCGTDGKTYGNSCTLRAAKCKNLLLEVAYEGECKPTPQPTKPACRDACPEIYKPVCGSNNVTYSNACEMEAACCKNPGLKLSKAYDGECGCVKGCPKIFLQVCGSDGKTYNNKCLLTNAACVNLTLTVAHDGPCEIDSASACAAVSCRQFSECKVDDATGRAYCADVCDPKRCAADEVCSLQQVQCVTSPCPPVAKCTKRA